MRKCKKRLHRITYMYFTVPILISVNRIERAASPPPLDNVKNSTFINRHLSFIFSFVCTRSVLALPASHLPSSSATIFNGAGFARSTMEMVGFSCILPTLWLFPTPQSLDLRPPPFHARHLSNPYHPRRKTKCLKFSHPRPLTFQADSGSFTADSSASH